LVGAASAALLLLMTFYPVHAAARPVGLVPCRSPLRISDNVGYSEPSTIVATALIEKAGSTVGWIYMDDRGILRAQLTGIADPSIRNWIANGNTYVKGAIYLVRRPLPNSLQLVACVSR